MQSADNTGHLKGFEDRTGFYLPNTVASICPVLSRPEDEISPCAHGFAPLWKLIRNSPTPGAAHLT